MFITVTYAFFLEEVFLFRHMNTLLGVNWIRRPTRRQRRNTQLHGCRWLYRFRADRVGRCRDRHWSWRGNLWNCSCRILRLQLCRFPPFPKILLWLQATHIAICLAMAGGEMAKINGVNGDVGNALNDHLLLWLAVRTLLVVGFLSLWPRRTPIYVGLCVAVRCHMTSSSAKVALAGSELAVLARSDEGSFPRCWLDPKDVGVAPSDSSRST